MISLSFAVLTLVFVPHTLDIENLKFKLTLLVRDPYIYGHDVACSVRGTRKQIKSIRRQPNYDIFGFPWWKILDFRSIK